MSHYTGIVSLVNSWCWRQHKHGVLNQHLVVVDYNNNLWWYYNIIYLILFYNPFFKLGRWGDTEKAKQVLVFMCFCLVLFGRLISPALSLNGDQLQSPPPKGQQIRPMAETGPRIAKSASIIFGANLIPTLVATRYW